MTRDSFAFCAFVASTTGMEFATTEGVGAIELGAAGGDATFGENVAPLFTWLEASASDVLAVAGKVRLFGVLCKLVVLRARFFLATFWFLVAVRSAVPFFNFGAFGGE